MLNPALPGIAKAKRSSERTRVVLFCNKTVNSITSEHFIVKSFLDFRHLAALIASQFMEFTQAVFPRIYIHPPYMEICIWLVFMR